MVFAGFVLENLQIEVKFQELRNQVGNFPATYNPFLMTTDPVADFITRVKNAGAVKKSSISVPYSSFKMAIAEKLKDAGFLASIDKKGKKIKKMIDVVLKYDAGGTHVIHGVKRISKPGRRLYRGAKQIVPVRYGHGALILSTPKGVLTDAEARKEKVGGEALFEIW